MVGAGVSPNRCRRRQLLAWHHVPVDEESLGCFSFNLQDLAAKKIRDVFDRAVANGISGTKGPRRCWAFWRGGGWPSLTDRSSRRPQPRTAQPGLGSSPAGDDRLFDGPCSLSAPMASSTPASRPEHPSRLPALAFSELLNGPDDAFHKFSEAPIARRNISPCSRRPSGCCAKNLLAALSRRNPATAHRIVAGRSKARPSKRKKAGRSKAG
jgi:hypothetical protein